MARSSHSENLALIIAGAGCTMSSMLHKGGQEWRLIGNLHPRMCTYDKEIVTQSAMLET